MREVQHQERAQRMLQRALASRRMPHAYLFAGPGGVGKETLAIGLAQTLLCGRPISGTGLLPVIRESNFQPERADEAQDVQSNLRAAHGPEGHASARLEDQATGSDGTGRLDDAAFVDACGQCADCRLVQAGTHPDLTLIYRQLNRHHPDSTIRKQKALVLGVEIIRHFLIDRAGTRPARGRAKIFIVREAERMNDAAQNSLLKTLEEPPRSTFILLLTSALDRMLPTTRSRCQPVHFSTLPTAFVIERLRQLRPDAPAPEIQYAGLRSGGSLGGALRQLDDGMYRLKQPWGEQLVQLARGGRGFAPHALGKPFTEDAKGLAKLVAERDPDVSDTDALRAALQSLLGALGDFYLDALRIAINAELTPINADQMPILHELARLTPAALAQALHAIAEAEANLSRNANIDLSLEALFISLSHAHDRALLV